MYRGFNLKIPDEFNFPDLIKESKKILEATNQSIKKTLNHYILNNGSLDGNKIIEDWFPEMDFKIFLSHSHKDEEKAMIIAAILYKKFNILTFIDSSIWGYSNELLREIDNKYCLHENGENYDYDKRNFSTTHVHLMLSTALNKMIDNSECLFFLNSPNSISISTDISQKTNSAWIYSEIATSKIIRKKTPDRLKQKTVLFSTDKIKALDESNQNRLSVEYELELSHLTDLNIEDLLKWLKTPANSEENALDNLYSQHEIKSKFLI
jgi:hypothetical protein